MRPNNLPENKSNDDSLEDELHDVLGMLEECIKHGDANPDRVIEALNLLRQILRVKRNASPTKN